MRCRAWVAVLVFPLVSLSVVPALAQTPAAVPTPRTTKVASDLPGTPGRNYPFFATDIVLANFGYVEEEFFYEGTANTYSAPEFGKNAEITKSGIPFRSRMLVRRPAQQSRFNGIVIVEWLNVTNGYDTDVLWLYQKEFFLREGYAWVGVSAQDGGVSREPNGIKVWSPTRYGRLDLTAGGTVTDATLNFDIYAQAGAAIRGVPEVLGGLKFRQVFAAGQSQSSGRLTAYLNTVHPGAPVYDAAFITVNNSPLRKDLAIPIISVLSETERFNSRTQPDSDKIRIWNVAGSTHSEQYSLLSRAAFLQRDLKLPAVDACETPARSRVEIRYVYNAAVDWLVKWKVNGSAPPHAPPYVFDENAPTPPPTPPPAAAPAAAPGARGGGRGGRGGGPPEKPVMRDRHGIILGGIRLAEVDAPVALESAELCGLGGTHVPFDTATLNTLYPTPAAYVSKVTAASNAAVKAGFLLPADAAQTIAAAKRSIYGQKLACGPLCADVRQFPTNPSSMLLAKQTEYLVIKDGLSLVRIVDAATKLIAEGYTIGDTPGGKRKFAEAAARLDEYIVRVKQLKTRGNMPTETETLLVNQATVLRDLVKGKAQ
jgi:Alpha/beta hydrolase domain